MKSIALSGQVPKNIQHRIRQSRTINSGHINKILNMHLIRLGSTNTIPHCWIKANYETGTTLSKDAQLIIRLSKTGTSSPDCHMSILRPHFLVESPIETNPNYDNNLDKSTHLGLSLGLWKYKIQLRVYVVL